MEGEFRSAKAMSVVYINGEKQASKTVNKLRYLAATVLLLFLVMGCVVAAALVLAVEANNSEQSAVYRTIIASDKPPTAYQRQAFDSTEEQHEHIEVVGDGHRFLTLEKGSRLQHWKISTKTGMVRLKHHSFIIIQVPGLYRVYGQYAVYQPSGAQPRTRTVSVLLMQNRKELSMSIVEHCKRLCTRSFSKTVELQKGDKLSLQSGTGGVFKVSSKCSYFGINLLRSNTVQQVKV